MRTRAAYQPSGVQSGGKMLGRLDKLVGMINTHIDDIGHHATAKGKAKSAKVK